MPHVTFGETYPTRRSHDESRALTRLPETEKGRTDDIAIIRRRSRAISYKIPEERGKERPKCKHPEKPIDKTCIERKTTYRDGCGNIIKITYEDSCGNITKTIYPTLPPAPEPPKIKCTSPPPPPPVSEPSNIPCEDVRNCNWTKIVVKNSRGVVWKIVHVDCYGKTMKTEYPREREPEAPRRRSSETRRYVVRELDEAPPRRRYSETKKIVVEKDFKVISDSKGFEKESDVHSSRKSSSDTITTTPSKRDSGVGSSDRDSGESVSEVLKDADGVTRRVTRTYVDSRGRRRTVIYDE